MRTAVTHPQPTRAPRAAPPSRRSVWALFAQGMRDQRRAALWWGGGLGAMSALMAAIWPSIENSMTTLLKSYPKGLKEAFGIEQLDTVEKYVDAEMLSLIVPFALVFLAIRCVTRATVAAEQSGHLDTLLSQPVSRRALVVASYAVTGCAVLLALAVVWAMTFVTGAAFGSGLSPGTLAVGLANVWPLALAFAGLAVVAGGVVHRAGQVTGITIGMLAAMYVMDLVGKLAPAFEPLRALSAYRYYGSAVQNGFDWSHAVGLVAVGVALAAFGAWLFERRDVL